LVLRFAVYRQLLPPHLPVSPYTTLFRSTCTADGINFVDKDNAGRLLLGLLAHIANPGSTHTDKHLHKVRTGDREERHPRLTRNGLGEQGFTGPRLANH